MENFNSKYEEWRTKKIDQYLYLGLSIIFVLVLWSLFSQVKSLFNLMDIDSIGGAFNSFTSGMSQVQSFKSKLSFLRFLALASIIFSIYEFFQFKEERNEVHKITFGIGSIFSFLMVYLLNPIYQALKTSGSSSSILGFFEDIGSNLDFLSNLSLSSLQRPIVFAFIVIIMYMITAIIVAFGLRKNKKVKLNFLRYEFSDDKLDINLSKDHKRKAIIAVLSVSLLFGAYKLWDTYLNKEKLDVFDYVTVEFSKVSGEGYPIVDFDVDAVPSSYNVSKVLDHVELIYDDEINDLKNGDQFKVRINVSPELLKYNKVKLLKEEKEYEVQGLLTIPDSFDQISNLEELEKDLEEMFNSITKYNKKEYNTTKRALLFSSASDSSYFDGTPSLAMVYEVAKKNSEYYDSFVVIPIFDLYMDQDKKVNDYTQYNNYWSGFYLTEYVDELEELVEEYSELNFELVKEYE